ncbi:MAG: PilZ domain-containing protein [Xanthobacteraceae bacterium]|jgi:hypothetical protein
MNERRCVPRTKVFRGAKAVLPGRAPISCIVRNLSTRGAGLQLANSGELPPEFDLTLDTGLKLRNCRIAWRTQTSVGVSFTPPV